MESRDPRRQRRIPPVATPVPVSTGPPAVPAPSQAGGRDASSQPPSVIPPALPRSIQPASWGTCSQPHSDGGAPVAAAGGCGEWWRPQPVASADESHTEMRPAAPLAKALSCRLCHGLLNEAISATECGHCFCYNCIESKIHIGGGSNTCPICGVTLGANPFETNKLKYDFILDALVRKVFPRPLLDTLLEARRCEREEATREVKAALRKRHIRGVVFAHGASVVMPADGGPAKRACREASLDPPQPRAAPPPPAHVHVALFPAGAEGAPGGTASSCAGARTPLPALARPYLRMAPGTKVAALLGWLRGALVGGASGGGVSAVALQCVQLFCCGRQLRLDVSLQQVQHAVAQLRSQPQGSGGDGGVLLITYGLAASGTLAPAASQEAQAMVDKPAQEALRATAAQPAAAAAAGGFRPAAADEAPVEGRRTQRASAAVAAAALAAAAAFGDGLEEVIGAAQKQDPARNQDRPAGGKRAITVKPAPAAPASAQQSQPPTAPARAQQSQPPTAPAKAQQLQPRMAPAKAQQSQPLQRQQQQHHQHLLLLQQQHQHLLLLQRQQQQQQQQQLLLQQQQQLLLLQQQQQQQQQQQHIRDQMMQQAMKLQRAVVKPDGVAAEHLQQRQGEVKAVVPGAVGTNCAVNPGFAMVSTVSKPWPRLIQLMPGVHGGGSAPSASRAAAAAGMPSLSGSPAMPLGTSGAGGAAVASPQAWLSGAGAGEDLAPGGSSSMDGGGSMHSGGCSESEARALGSTSVGGAAGGGSSDACI